MKWPSVNFGLLNRKKNHHIYSSDQSTSKSYHLDELSYCFKSALHRRLDSFIAIASTSTLTRRGNGHLPPITKTIQVRRTRHAGHCWRSKDELISDVLLWTPTYGCAKVGRPARTYIQQLCEDTGCNPEDLSEAMNDREKWRERVRDICAGGATWWWWWWNMFQIEQN